MLLGLLDAGHTKHEAAVRWLEGNIAGGWASCAITEMGYVRVVSQSSYPLGLSTRDAVARLDEARSAGPHEFWPCDVSLIDETVIARDRLLGAKQVTDAYLLALAVAHDGRFVTLDKRVPLATVVGAEARHLIVI